MNSTSYFLFQIQGQQWQMENGHSYQIAQNPDPSVPNVMKWIPLQIQ